jgi:hypothetical protein
MSCRRLADATHAVLDVIRVMLGGGAGSRDEFGPMAGTRRRRFRADLVLGLLLLKQNPSDKSRG